MYLIKADGFKPHCCTHYTLAKVVANDLLERYPEIGDLSMEHNLAHEFFYNPFSWVQNKNPNLSISITVNEEDHISLIHTHYYNKFSFQKEKATEVSIHTDIALNGAGAYKNKFHKFKCPTNILCLSNRQMIEFDNKIRILLK